VSAGELLLEVRTEEIPARMLPDAIRELATRLFEELVKLGLTPGEIEAGHTPRRLWIVMKGVPGKGKDVVLPLVGPPASAAFNAQGEPTKAAEGFARKLGIEVSRIRRREFTPGESEHELLRQEEAIPITATGTEVPSPKPVKARGEYAYVVGRIEGRRTHDVLAELVPTLLGNLSWPKTMKWGSGVGPWVRPVHGIVALLDGEVVPFALFGIESGRVSAGHPILSPEPFPVTDVESWRQELASRGIVASPEERKMRLRSGMQERARAAVGALVEDDALLDKLAAICEIPGLLEGSFEPGLLELPREVLVTSLRDHQSALTVERDGALLPIFLTVMDRPDDPAGRVRAGNEWVVAARLADARFFWSKDRATPLEKRVDELEGLGFHRDLGSYGGRRSRTLALCSAIGKWAELSNEELGHLDTAAGLAKTDLVTEMVREFTSLQGVMGGVYAREEGLPEAVWTAIYDQYLPTAADDPLPRGRVGRILALADRIDLLVGFFGLGLIPTGSRDPFALRRAALGVVRLLPEFGTRIDLAELVRQAHSGYAVRLAKSAEETWTSLRPFFEDRLRYLYELEGFAYDEIEAGLRRPGETLAHLEPLRARIEALHGVRADREFLSVVLAARRIANIIKDQAESSLEEGSLELAAERDLVAAGGAFASTVEAAIGSDDYASGFAAVARLAPALERFFAEVLVMDPDEAKRSSRLAILQGIHRTILQLADLSQLVVDKSDYR